MTNSSNEPTEPQKPDTKSATIWAIVVGLITAGLVIYILGSQTILMRLIAGAASGVAVGISTYRKSIATKSNSGDESS